jgi:N-methylhydantoinase A/oxoprolinase/acetone carboxylase beta subunit
MTYRLGVDVGGTFTDVLLIDERTGGTYRAKTASTPDDQSVGVLRGIEKVCGSAGITLADITQVLHGTTVATNAILEGKGARVGLVTTQGFRQVLQIARSFVPGGLAGWIIWPKPEPLASLEDTVEAIERIASDGSVVTALDDDDIRAKLRTLRAAGVEALTISLINSYANAAHEERIAAIAAEELPDVPLSVSSAVLPELREYERTITAVANSYVHPQVSRYIASLAAKLDDGGVSAGLYILRSDGGLASAASAADSPVSMLRRAGGLPGLPHLRPGVGTVRLPDGAPDPSAALARTTRIWVDGSHADTAVYDRTALRAGNVVTGPAIITEMDSTTLVLPGHAATVHPSGSLLIRPTEG